MSETDIPDDVKGFIVRYIDSVGKLEVLLLLVSNPQKSWTGANVSQELRSTDASADKHLADLAAKELLVATKNPVLAYSYRPPSEEIAETVRRLVAAKAIFWSRMIHLIYNKPMAQIRQFAQAFRIRKENDDG